MAETKIVYHIGEDTPYLVCLPIPPEELTLGDFTREINKTTGYRYYFKTRDEDLIVKQEIKDPAAVLPCYHSRVIAWIIPDITTNGKAKGGLVNGNSTTEQPSRPTPSASYGDSDASSIFSDASSVISSGIESTSESISVVDSDEERSRDSRQRQRRRKRKKQIKPPQRCSSFSSMTESTSTMNIITVTLDMEASSYLGFSIYSPLDDSSFPGTCICVGQIYKGGAVEADGRISPNDIIMSVNDISFESIGSGEAARILQETAKKTGPVRLVVAKTNRDSMVDLHESDYTDAETVSIASSHTTFSYTLDPTAQWIQQQQKGAGNFGFNFNENSYYPTSYSLYSTTGSESPANSQVGGDTIRGQHQPPQPLDANSKMDDVVSVMSRPSSGLEIKERIWLKVTIPDAFIGQDLVKWLKEHISSLSAHKDARIYASRMLKNGYINNTVNKSDKFSDQCYYVCGDGTKALKGGSADRLHSDMQGMSVDPSQRSTYHSWGGKAGSVRSQGSAGTMSSSSPRSAPRGLVAARPGPGSSGSRGSGSHGSGPPSYRGCQPGGPVAPPSYHSYISGPKPTSQLSGFAPVPTPQQPAPPADPAAGQLVRADSVSSLASVYSQHSMMSMPGRPLGSAPNSVTGSQASFRMAMDNSIEYYSDAV